MSNIREKAEAYRGLILANITAASGTQKAKIEKLLELGYQAYVHVGTESDVLRTAENANKPYPKIVVHNRKTFPDGSVWQIDEATQINLALGGLEPETGLDDVGDELIDAFSNYFRSSKTQTEETAHDKNRLKGTAGGISGGRDRDELKRGGRPERRVDEFVYGVRKKFGERNYTNTWSHINDSKEEWFIALNYVDPFGRVDETLKSRAAYLGLINQAQWKLLTQEFGPEWNRGDLAAHLRVRAGRSTTEASVVTGMWQQSFAVKERARYKKLLYSTAMGFLNVNLYRFPEIDGVVEAKYADKFLERMGYGELIFVQNNAAAKQALFDMLAFIVDGCRQAPASAKGTNKEIKFNQLPAINHIFRYVMDDYCNPSPKELSHTNQSVKLVKLIRKSKYPTLKELLDSEYPEHGIEARHIDILDKLPVIYSTRMGPVPQPFDEGYVFEVAKKEATTPGEFVRIFRGVKDETIETIADRRGVRPTAQMQAERSKYYYQNAMNELLGERNPYQLPTGKDGKVREDIGNFVTELNIESRKNNKPGRKKKVREILDEDRSRASPGRQI